MFKRTYLEFHIKAETGEPNTRHPLGFEEILTYLKIIMEEDSTCHLCFENTAGDILCDYCFDPQNHRDNNEHVRAFVVERILQQREYLQNLPQVKVHSQERYMELWYSARNRLKYFEHSLLSESKYKDIKQFFNQ